MQRALRFIVRINRTYPNLSSIVVASVLLLIDIATDKEIQFPLVYVVPVGMAVWRRRRVLAYGMAVILPILRFGHELASWGEASLVIVGLNAMIEIAAMGFYAFLIGKMAAQTGQLKNSISTKEVEIGQLRAFTTLTGMAMQGRGLSPGMAEGVAWVYQPPDSEWTSVYEPIGQGDIEKEIERLDTALAASIRELEVTQKNFAGAKATAESALLDIQLAMLGDAGFWNRCRQRVREELVAGEQAVAEEVLGMVAKLEGMKQEVMRERGADVRDIGLRVLRNMGVPTELTSHGLEALPPHTVLVAKELLPSDMFQLDHVNLAALVTEHNGPASHVAILAWTRNIPAVSDIKDAAALLSTGDRLLVDAAAGSVTVAPTRVQEELFAERKNRYATRERVGAQDAARTSATKDGVRIGLSANIIRPDEARLALEYRLHGVGLFRTEFLFLDVPQPPAVDAQAAVYAGVAKLLAPHPVIIRTMDFGGDKIPQFSSTENTLAFRTGNRGLAFSLSEKTLFRTQLQAILRAAQAGDVRIMFPMVMGVADLREALHLVDEVKASEHVTARVPVGAMVETPAAVIYIGEIVKMVDFVSLGTNDLAHFILGTDRQSQESSGTAAFLHPSVLRAVEHVVRTALRQGIGLSVCGEAAGDPASACLLVGMGVRNLSMNPFQAAGIRQLLQRMTLGQMEAVARDALGVATLEDVQQVVSHALLE